MAFAEVVLTKGLHPRLCASIYRLKAVSRSRGPNSTRRFRFGRRSSNRVVVDDAVDDRPAWRGEQRGRAVALVIVGHRSASSGLERQAGLGAIEPLYLALLVDRDDGLRAWASPCKVNDVLDLLGVRDPWSV
jgi:hypothetical protein